VQELQAADAPNDNTGEPLWVVTVCRRIKETALPVFNRQEQVNRDMATSIRFAVLCLGAEADARFLELGEAFRDIAAGITLL
jgi:hypothetical protein